MLAPAEQIESCAAFSEAGQFVGTPFDAMYRVEKQVYSSQPGARKQIYSAHEHIDEAHVAIKMFDQSMAGHYETELNTAEQFRDQPGFVPFRGFGDHRTESGVYVPYLVFDFEEKGTLESSIREKELPGSEEIKELAMIMHGIAGALHAVHSEGLVYRDVKPGNILQSEDHDGMLCDFDSVTEEGEYDSVVGTVGYIAPEALHGHVRSENDVFSHGVTLYRAVTHEFPWHTATQEDYVDNVLRGDTPVFPDRLNPAVPFELSRLIMSALIFDPNRRPDIRHFQKALEYVD